MKQQRHYDVEFEQQGKKSTSLIGDYPQVFQVDGNFYYQVGHLESARQPLFPLAPIPDPGIFIERKVLLNQIERFFLRHSEKICILEGIGGIGKTTFAAYVCRMFRQYFKDVYWGVCREESTAEQFVGELSNFLARNQENPLENSQYEHQFPLQIRMQAQLQQFEAHRYLLVFDDFETLLDYDGHIKDKEIAYLFQELIQGGHQSKLLLLSRRSIVFHRQPAGVITRKRIEGLHESATQHLFTRLGIQISSEKIEALHRKVGGHPLALVILADLYDRGLSVEQLLTIPFRHLSQTSKETFDDLFAELWAMMTPDEIEVLQRLSVYRVPVLLEALQGFQAKSRCISEGVSCPDILPNIIQRLGERCLVNVTKNERNQYTYTIPNIIREFAFRGLTKRQEHTYHVQAAAYWESLDLEKNPFGVERLQAQAEAHYHYFQAEEYEKATQLALALSERMVRFGLYSMAKDLLLKTINTVISEENLAISYNNLGNVYFCQGDYIQASEYYVQARKIFEEIGYTEGLTIIYNNIATVCASQGEYHQALTYYIKSREILEHLQLQPNLATIYNNIGFVYASLGEYAKALKYHEQALNIQERLGLVVDLASSYNNIGFLYDCQREYSLALDYYQRSKEIREKVGSESDIAESYNNIGGVYTSQHEFDQALYHYEQAKEILERLGLEVNLARCHNNIGLVSASQGKFDLALQQYEQARAIQEKLKLEIDLARTYTNIGVVYAFCEDAVQALEYYERAREIQERLELDADLSITFSNIGQIYYEQGDYQKAEQALSLTIHIQSKLQHPDLEYNLDFLEHVRHHIRRKEGWIKTISNKFKRKSE